METKTLTLCDGCPILNGDYEYGESCNLSYHTRYMHNEEADILSLSYSSTVSENCQLDKVIYIDGETGIRKEFIPDKKALINGN